MAGQMKIAAVSEDGMTISQHFGRAPFYVVVTVEDGKIVSREKRDKMGQAQFAAEPYEEHGHEADPRGHGLIQLPRIVTPAWTPPSAIARFCWCAA